MDYGYGYIVYLPETSRKNASHKYDAMIMTTNKKNRKNLFFYKSPCLDFLFLFRVWCECEGVFPFNFFFLSQQFRSF